MQREANELLLQQQKQMLAAAYKGNTAKIAEALKKGVDVESRDKLKQTALILASSNGHVEATKLLLTKGASVNAKDRYGRTALIWGSVIFYNKKII